MRDVELTDSREALADKLPTNWIAEIIVVPKRGVNDPEGTAILNGLIALGYDQVRDVEAGRYFEVVLAADDSASASAAVEQLCDRLIANPVIEAYRFVLRPADAASENAARDRNL